MLQEACPGPGGHILTLCSAVFRPKSDRPRFDILNIHTCMCIYIYKYIYININNIFIFIYIYLYMYIYIYVKKR